MVPIKTPKEIEVMREGGHILALIMKELLGKVALGVRCDELDRLAKEKIRKARAKPAFLNYKAFPAALCTSLNEEVVHGIPSAHKLLRNGDILTLDLGLIWKGYYTDMARTVLVGKGTSEAIRLVSVCKTALELGIEKAQRDASLGDLAHAIQQYIQEQGFGVVRELCGHGIGKELHEEPMVLNYGEKGTGLVLKEGMVICIEPMITAGDWKVKVSGDGHTFVTQDGSLSAHFEDTVAITSQGHQVLTKLSWYL